MCCKNNENCCKKSCACKKITKVLLIIGGINWGLVGVGMLLGMGDSLNVVNMIFGSVPVVEAIIYILVGIAGVMKIFGCMCKKSSDNSCCAENKTEEIKTV